MKPLLSPKHVEERASLVGQPTHGPVTVWELYQSECRIEAMLMAAVLLIEETIRQTKEQIMSAISDFAAKQNAFNDRMDAAITDLQGDVKTLNDEIAALQASPGTITPADQALLDGLQTRASGIADKLDALDALTPPAPPAPTP